MKTIVVLSIILLACGMAYAGVTSDGSIFTDNFSTGTLDTAVWGVSKSDLAEVAVSNGAMYWATHGSYDYGAHVYTNSVLNYGSATEWAVEIRFRVAAHPTALSNGAGDRSVSLIRGMSDAVFPDSYAQTRDFAVMLLDYEQGMSAYTLGWDWWNGAGTTPLVSGLSLARDTWYDLVLYHKSDNTVDFYLEGSLIANKTSLGGAPARLYTGDGTGNAGGIVYFDHIKVGAPVGAEPVPEPGTLLALGSSLIGLASVAVRRRRM